MIDLPGLIHHPDGTKDFQPRWYPDQEAELARLWKKGMGPTSIGKRLGKGRASVQVKLKRMGLS